MAKPVAEWKSLALDRLSGQDSRLRGPAAWLFGLLWTALPVWGWTPVGTGIEYQEYTISGPNNIFVARMDRGNQGAIIESSIGQGRLTGGTERTTSQAIRYDDAINYWDENWGQRNDVVVAVNGSYYNISTGVPDGGLIHSGWYAKRYDEFGWSGFTWQLDRDALIGLCVRHEPSKQYLTYLNSGATQTFQGINRARGSNELIVYTPQYDTTTQTDNAGTEVLVELPRPAMLLSSTSGTVGVVRQIRQNQGSTQIPFDHVVLSASGSAVTSLLGNVSVGSQVRISQEIRSLTGTCSSNYSLDWSRSYAAVAGNWVFLRDGVIQTGIDSSGLRHPRTAIALNDTHVFFIVVDGRTAISIGMTIDELAGFCKNTLGATWAVNQDGGGSSTMVVNGVIKNKPSDGSERSVSNGTMMLNLQPKLQSLAFAPTHMVKVNTANTNLRLGPGTNYASIASLAKNTEGAILDHALGGVYAKGFYWWKVNFGGTQGWVAESLLDFVSGNTPPTILTHPVDQTTTHGGSASFSIQVGGTGASSYRWLRNDQDLVQGGHYQGVLTDNLIVSPADKSDEGTYRCRATNGFGDTLSNPVGLSVISPDFDSNLFVDLADFGHLQNCLGLIDVATTAPECLDADLNSDNKVNGLDFNIFRGCINGVSLPPPPTCAGLFPPMP